MNAEQLAKSLTDEQIKALLVILRANITTDELFDFLESEQDRREAKANYSGAFAALADSEGFPPGEINIIGAPPQDDEPILYLFNDYCGGVTKIAWNERGSRLPLASLRLLQENPEFVINELEVGRLYQVVEGVIGRNSQNLADIVLLEKAEDDWGEFQ